jgi:hypothetical protein
MVVGDVAIAVVPQDDQDLAGKEFDKLIVLHGLGTQRDRAFFARSGQREPFASIGKIHVPRCSAEVISDSAMAGSRINRGQGDAGLSIERKMIAVLAAEHLRQALHSAGRRRSASRASQLVTVLSRSAGK